MFASISLWFEPVLISTGFQVSDRDDRIVHRPVSGSSRTSPSCPLAESREEGDQAEGRPRQDGRKENGYDM